MGQTNDVFPTRRDLKTTWESRTVIADTRRNIVVNSSELGFNVVSYRSSNSYASRSNSSELGFNIIQLLTMEALDMM